MDQLGLYNGALRILRERKLASLTENREPRRLLDEVWGAGPTGSGAVKYCLQMGQWTFATRTVRADYSPSVEPDFGLRYAFDQPEDMVRICGLWSDEFTTQPLLNYKDERHFWYADLPTIYASYVSNHASYGADLSLWPETFGKLVEAYLAVEIAGNLTQGTDLVVLADRAWKKAKIDAQSLDAMNKATQFMPDGRWTLARRGWGSRNNSLWDGTWS
jgi:hypothetical protein